MSQQNFTAPTGVVSLGPRVFEVLVPEGRILVDAWFTNLATGTRADKYLSREVKQFLSEKQKSPLTA